MKGSKQEFTWRCLPVNGCAAYRTLRRADPCGRFSHSLNFVSGPPAETVPIWIIAAPKFLALAADRALDAQIVIAALEPMQFELERRVVLGTSGNAVPPIFLHDLMSLFY